MLHKLELLDGGWVRLGSLVAFPYQWQQPAKTEEWIYEYLLEKKFDSKFVEFICFPWATLIDYILKGKTEKVHDLLNALNYLPKKKKFLRVTACQHINVTTILDLLISKNISDLFWSHKKKDKFFLKEIRLYPLALYPVAYFDGMPKYIRFNERDYFYSFIGAYDKDGYIDDSRKKIFSMKHLSDTVIKQRKLWHFEKIVYGEQINGVPLSKKDFDEYRCNMDEYKNVLINSQYSLCPSGAGVNSIRLWESILYGCIPIIFSPEYDFPKINAQVKFINFDGDVDEFDFNSIDRSMVQCENIKPDDFLYNLSLIFENSYILSIVKRPLID